MLLVVAFALLAAVSATPIAMNNVAPSTCTLLLFSRFDAFLLLLAAFACHRVFFTNKVAIISF